MTVQQIRRHVLDPGAASIPAPYAPGDADGFFAHLARAPRRLLMLDYDGTLAPFQVARDQAVPYPGVPAALNTMMAAGHSRIVIISGRAAADIPPLLALDGPVEIWGSHGAERLRPDGSYHAERLPRSVRDAFARAEEWAVEHHISERFERKPAAVALHWRGLTERARASLQADAEHHWQMLVDQSAAMLHQFDGGLELRAPGFDKDAVVRTLLAEEGEAAAAAFLGDDLTDEDGFVAIAERGLGVLVRAEPRSTYASVWLKPPQELLAFLERWNRAAALV